MILVLLGTFPAEFRRPLIEIEKLCKEGVIREKVLVQSGHTSMKSSYMEMVPFIPPDELIELYKNARIIITHAGTGSLIKGIRLNKKIIAIARLAKYGEVVDDHQTEILNEFFKMHYLLSWKEDVSLKDLLKIINDFQPASYVSNKESIANYLKDYIDSI